MLIELTRKELKNKGASMYAEGVIIKCNKYYIHISYDNGKWKHASIVTTVNTENDIRDLPINKQPAYIRDFIEDNNLKNRDFNYKIGDKIHHIMYSGEIIKDRIDIITGIVENMWGDIQYSTKEISCSKDQEPKIGLVYEKWVTRVV